MACMNHCKDFLNTLRGKSSKNHTYSNRSNLAGKSSRIKANLYNYLCFEFEVECGKIHSPTYTLEYNSCRNLLLDKWCNWVVDKDCNSFKHSYRTHKCTLYNYYQFDCIIDKDRCIFDNLNLILQDSDQNHMNKSSCNYPIDQHKDSYHKLKLFYSSSILFCSICMSMFYLGKKDSFYRNRLSLECMIILISCIRSCKVDNSFYFLHSSTLSN